MHLERLKTLQDEWLSRRNSVLQMLAKAKNPNGCNIGSLEEYDLATGWQTIKTSDTWGDWMDNFLDWLAAIDEGRTANASFLFPHNDFGPDLVFALRRRQTPRDIIVCSIQVSRACRRPEHSGAKRPIACTFLFVHR